MDNEIDGEITESEMKDDALESKMRKLEQEASRLLNQSSELLQALNKEISKQEEIKQDNSEVTTPEENGVIISSPDNVLP